MEFLFALEKNKSKYYKIKFDIELSNKEDRMNLFAMTPYFYRTSRADFEKLEKANGLITEVEFNVEVYRK